MPNDLKWCQLAQKGDSTPKPRSGHTITWTGSNNYVMYGGIEDPEGMNKVVPNSDVWSMKLMLKECRWEKEQCPGEEGETPPPRTQHAAHCIPNRSAIFVFGGHAGPTQRLNDCWWLKMQDGRPSKWCRVEGCKDVEENKESTISAPPPRANMGSCINGNKIYIYGGHGGLNYQRTAFSDIYSFDIDTCEWKQYEPVVQAQPPPLGRGGNSIFVVDDKLYSYGGWNAESQYTNLLVFDLNTCEWNDPDIFNGVARWNHCAAMVEAIPSWKYFIFGGESTDFGEAQPRTFGGCVSSSCYMDLDTLNWQTIAPEDPECPEPREYSAMAYDERDRRLVIFGGWNNGWMKDLYALDVSKIVGPSYACTHISPPLGQISGGVEITLKGVGFTSNNI
jgi:dynein heavy chain